MEIFHKKRASGPYYHKFLLNFILQFWNLASANLKSIPQTKPPKCISKSPTGMYQHYWLQSFKLYNVDFSRQIKLIAIKSNSFKVGINSVANRLPTINNRIPLSWLNLSLDTYKVKCKQTLLNVWIQKFEMTNWQGTAGLAVPLFIILLF